VRIVARAPEDLGAANPHNIGTYYNDSWAIVVGVDKYKSPRVQRLSYAAADAESVAQALPGVGFPPDHIEVLRNTRASLSGIKEAIY